jgi:hypothetical protein
MTVGSRFCVSLLSGEVKVFVSEEKKQKTLIFLPTGSLPAMAGQLEAAKN